MRRVGFIGVGTMGGPMACNICTKGFSLTVYDKNPEAVKWVLDNAGGIAASSPKHVAENSDAIMFMLPRAENIEEAIFGKNGVIDALRPGTILINTSTVLPDYTISLESRLLDKNVKVVDAPVAKTRDAAIKGELVVMAGGKQEDIEEVRPILEAIGTEIYVCGPLGSGNVVKIVNNLIMMVTMCFLPEALVLGVKAGVDLNTLVEVLCNAPATCFTLENHVRQYVVPREYPKGIFPVEYAIKDLECAEDLATENDVPLVFASLSKQLYKAFMAMGERDTYYPAVMQLFETLAGKYQSQCSLQMPPYANTM